MYGRVVADPHVLAGAAQQLLTGDPTAFEWARLATGWLQLGDATTAAHYLDHAAAVARTADDRCIVAAARYRAGDPGGATKLLVEAERGANVADLCAIAATFAYPLGDPYRADACFARARDLAVTATDLEVAIRADGQHRDLSRLESLAASFDDWLGVARMYMTVTFAPTDCGRCCDRAAKLASTAAQRDDLALVRTRLQQHPFVDLASHPCTPGELVRPGARTVGWPRDPTPLVEVLRRQVTRTQLREVASGDYGYGFDQAHPELVGIADTGLVPHPLQASHEVLALARWSRTRGPAMRALACALLLLDDAAGGLGVNGSVEPTLVILVETAREVGCLDEAVSFCAAFADDRLAGSEDALHADLALAVLAAHRDPLDPRVPILGARLADDHRIATIDRKWHRQLDGITLPGVTPPG